MAYSAGVQALIYSRGPCYTSPLKCVDSAEGTIPNHVNVWIQVPSYVFIGASEIFFQVTLYQYAYEKAPASMKTVVLALSTLASAVGLCIGIGFSALQENPLLTINYIILAAVALLGSVAFFWYFRKCDKDDRKVLTPNSSTSTLVE